MRDRRLTRPAAAWAMYDWANSAYMLTTVTAVLPVFFASVVVPPGGVPVAGHQLAATTLWAIMVGLADLAIFLAAPILGALADAGGCKRAFLAACCLAGGACAFLLAFAAPGAVWPTAALFVCAQAGFAGGNVFYDAFLPDVAPPGRADWVSGLGYAAGYLGGGLHFLACLLLVQFHDAAGLSREAASRVALGSAALWWLLFAAPALAVLRENRPHLARPPWRALLAEALTTAGGTFRAIAGSRRAGAFLAAFLLYNDGIQTIITMATIYGQDELKLPLSTLMLTLLVIQALAMVGSVASARLAERFGAKPVLMGSLAVWTGVVLVAYGVRSARGYMFLGALVGLVLGGSQALSRSLFAAMIPPGKAAQYFGYYSVVSKLSAVAGPFVFAGVRHATGSSRAAILPIVGFFVAGLALLAKVPPAPTSDADEPPLSCPRP